MNLLWRHRKFIWHDTICNFWLFLIKSLYLCFGFQNLLISNATVYELVVNSPFHLCITDTRSNSKFLLRRNIFIFFFLKQHHSCRKSGKLHSTLLNFNYKTISFPWLTSDRVLSGFLVPSILHIDLCQNNRNCIRMFSSWLRIW